MWPLRQNVQYNKHYFFKEILGFVFVAHLGLLMLLFFYDAGRFHQERFIVNKNNVAATIVFMPLKKRADVSDQKSIGQQSHQGKPGRIMHLAEFEKQRAAQSQKNIGPGVAVGAQKQPQAEVLSKSEQPAPRTKQVYIPVQKSATSLKQDFDKKVHQKKLADLARLQKIAAEKAAEKIKKEKAALAQKALEQKKLAAEKAATVKKMAEKKAAEKIKQDKAAQDKKAAEKKLVDQVKVSQKATKAPTPVVTPPSVSQNVSAVATPLQKITEAAVQPVLIEQVDQVNVSLSGNQADISALGQDTFIDFSSVAFVGSYDLEMLKIKEQIKLEVSKYYKPPVGIAKTAVCDFVISIGFDGKAQEVILKKSSGSVANDICARVALLKAKYPKELMGKEIILEVGQ